MIQAVILGAGNRGTTYTRLLNGIPDAEVAALCDPRTDRRDALAAECKNKDSVRTFSDWREILKNPGRIADFAIIATQDRDHREAAVELAKRGYHILLEKPMAPNREDCEAIVEAVKKAGVIFGVCHVLRYTPYWAAVKKVMESGRLGEIASIQHLESVVYWHQAHGFVRGNWSNSKESSPILLAKSCHDIDILRWLAGCSCLRVSSFGSLGYLNPEHKPEGAAARCLDCPERIEKDCPYSAVKIYWRDRAEKGLWGWPIDILIAKPDREELFKALREGPYGRCVFACDNDVCDRQVVNMEFERGLTASFTLTAFTSIDTQRRTTVFGSRAMLVGDGEKIEIHDFLTDSTTSENVVKSATGNIADGHGGGDRGLMNAFLNAIRTGDRSSLCTGADETLESHRIVFAAEEARKSGKVIEMNKFKQG